MTVDTSLNKPSADAAVSYPTEIENFENRFARQEAPSIPLRAS